MFEVPDAKRVRREDLYSSSDEEDVRENGSSQEDADLLRQKLSSLLAINLAVPPQNETEGDTSMVDAGQDQTQPLPENEANQEEEFTFRLFSSAPTQKVVLAPKEDEIIASTEDIPFKERPLSYYIQKPLTPEEQEQIRHSALSGQDILALSKQRAWGLEVPWRVARIEIVASTKKPAQPTAGGKTIEEGDKKKKRPGKKTRIKFRINERKHKEEESKKLTKEEHLKEKKKRLNREKKLKRRQKEKAKKAANGTAGEQDEGDKMSEDGDSGEK